MKVIVSLLLILSFEIGFSQTENIIFFNNHVECYFDNGSLESLVVYDSIGGSIIETLRIEDGKQKYRWFKIAIQESNEGWMKIENIMVVPGPNDSINASLRNLKNNWIKMENLKINTTDISLSDSIGIPFYDKPDTNSRLICESGTFLELTLLDTKGIWAKVSFEHNGIVYIGWMERENGCAYPWTACP